MGWLERLEMRALRWITCDWESEATDLAAALANDPVFGTCAFSLLFLLVATRARARARMPRALAATVLGMGIAHAVLFVAWRVAPRARPGDHFPEDRTLTGPIERATCGGRPDMWVERAHPPKSPAFPSSHSVTAGAVAAGLTTASAAAGVVGWAYALAVGAARLYGGKHWPTDVLGGFAIAAASVWLAWRLVPRAAPLLPRRRGREAT